jgi:hypothetical protein
MIHAHKDKHTQVDQIGNKVNMLETNKWGKGVLGGGGVVGEGLCKSW